MRRLFVFIFMICSVLKVMAQQEEGTLRIEPNLGLSITNLTHAGTDASVGAVLDMNAQYQVSEKFGMVMGLDYANLGARCGHIKFTLGYIELVPVLAKYYVYKGLSVYTGAEFGYKVYDNIDDIDILFFPYANEIHVGIPVGMSYDWKHFSINAQYDLGLTKVFQNYRNKSRGVRITLGYKI